ncbi:hypothetical protein FSP39_022301 [Pinctada imbricata]|uniref:RCC1-like domain-containing protein n=1 Tax=Pinctada imbricata TaxID=66713 RepID=A0AA88YPH1_PINIB|nr:hypothetical protein FSP39_022301 [Pinctada imbricata]
MSVEVATRVGRAGQPPQLYSWGANSHGQLGLGHREDQLLPREVIVDSNQAVGAVSGGGGHTMCILEDSFLLTCGSNDKGQIGNGDWDCTALTRRTLSGGECDVSVHKAVGGWDFTLLLDNKGVVYSMGSNTFGQLGRSDVSKTLDKVEFPGNNKITDIAAGLRHCAAVTDTGSVYCWGAGRKGQLGILQEGKPPNKLLTPTKVESIPSQAVAVATGAYHTLILTDTGQLLSWGDNRHGQTGQDPLVTTQVTLPTILQASLMNEAVEQVHSGWTHNVVLTKSGKLFTWGRADYGQLGRPYEQSPDFMPRPITGVDVIKSVSCGSEHNLACSVSGKLYSWGWNEHGICGTGDEVNVPYPKQVAALDNRHVTSVGCGAGHSFAVCQSDP